MTRQTSVQFDEERKSLQIHPTTDQQIRDLVDWGYGSSMTEVVRHAVREAWQRHIGLGNELPELTVANTEIVHIDGLEIDTSTGTLTDGYKLTITLGHADSETTVDALNLVRTADQNADWCVRQCQQLADRLARQAGYTPGQLLRLLKCGFQPFNELGVPTPPMRKPPTEKEYEEFHSRTGKAMMYLENDQYREWAIIYNAWIREHPGLAEDYGCQLQDENWVPVK